MPAKDNGERVPANAEEAQRLHERLEQLNAEANAGKPGALAELEAFLNDHEEVMASIGDLARHAEKAWINHVVGTDSCTRIAVTSQIKRLKGELTGPDPSPLERLLVEHVVVAHLAEREAVLSAARRSSMSQGSFDMKKAESAQKRFLAAAKSLATFRSMQPRNSRPRGTLKLFDPDTRKTA